MEMIKAADVVIVSHKKKEMKKNCLVSHKKKEMKKNCLLLLERKRAKRR